MQGYSRTTSTTFSWIKVKPVVHTLRKIAVSLQLYGSTIKYIPGQKVQVADTLCIVSPSDKKEIKGFRCNYP